MFEASVVLLVGFHWWFLELGIEAITPAAVRRKRPAMPAISLGGC